MFEPWIFADGIWWQFVHYHCRVTGVCSKQTFMYFRRTKNWPKWQVEQATKSYQRDQQPQICQPQGRKPTKKNRTSDTHCVKQSQHDGYDWFPKMKQRPMTTSQRCEPCPAKQWGLWPLWCNNLPLGRRLGQHHQIDIPSVKQWSWGPWPPPRMPVVNEGLQGFPTEDVMSSWWSLASWEGATSKWLPIRLSSPFSQDTWMSQEVSKWFVDGL